ncbi:DUF2933 domain-containing protein [Neobacillus sp. Marseille-QA0830]
MEWLSFLLVLICPLMMIVMMRGHGGHGTGPKHHHEGFINELDSKMAKLELENEKLRNEVHNLSSMLKKES